MVKAFGGYGPVKLSRVSKPAFAVVIADGYGSDFYSANEWDTRHTAKTNVLCLDGYVEWGDPLVTPLWFGPEWAGGLNKDYYWAWGSYDGT